MMPPGRTPTRGLALVIAALVGVAVMVPATATHAELSFRKKKPAAEPAPKGGEVEGEVSPASATEGEEGAAKPAPTKTDYVPQADDPDRPRDPTLIQKPAEAQATKQAKRPEGPPLYTKWQFWA